MLSRSHQDRNVSINRTSVEEIGRLHEGVSQLTVENCTLRNQAQVSLTKFPKKNQLHILLSLKGFKFKSSKIISNLKFKES